MTPSDLRKINRILSFADDLHAMMEGACHREREEGQRAARLWRRRREK